MTDDYDDDKEMEKLRAWWRSLHPVIRSDLKFLAREGEVRIPPNLPPPPESLDDDSFGFKDRLAKLDQHVIVAKEEIRKALVLAAIIALVVLVVKRLTTPKFAPVPEPLLDKPWTTTNPFARPMTTPTTTTKRPSMNQFGGYQGLGGRTYSTPTKPVDLGEPEDKPCPVAGQAALGSAPRPKPSVSTYRGLSKPKPAYQGMNISLSLRLERSAPCSPLFWCISRAPASLALAFTSGRPSSASTCLARLTNRCDTA